MPRYQVLDHTADIRLRIFARTRRELFQNGVWAVMNTITDARQIQKKQSRQLVVRGETLEELFLRLLKEVLYLFDTRHFLIRSLEVKENRDTLLRGVVWGEPLKGHCLKTEIKAVTYHRLSIKKVRGRWVAEVVIDV
ncbi:MAG: archease [Deltaproteobacteria bacterium]|nr:archease [Deltaproteobacteria bacterium]MBI2500936.1 archease [Deltaproteobacteria bacterium]